MSTDRRDAAAAIAHAFIPGPPDGLCLAFANTRYWRGSDPPTEELNAPEDLLRWAGEARALDGATLARIAARWATEPREAASSLAAALAVREAIFRVFAATSSGRAPPKSDLAALNAALREAPERRHLRPGPEGFGWELPATPCPGLRELLAPVLWSAGDLLVGARLGRVRQCANPRCLWLFLDESKSGNRRWCSMASCGNRAKAHRHYARKRKGEG